MPDNNPYINRKKHPKHGQKAEKRTAKRLGGQVRAGSGAIEGYKGDITLHDFLVENKTTIHRSLSLKLDWLRKISVEAREEGRAPALAVQFVDSEGVPVRYGRWVMVPEDEFKEMTSEAEV